jgi:YVTN family beta-propeller protein
MAYSPSRKRLYVAAIETFYAFTESGSLDFSVPLAVPPEGSDSLAQTAGGYKVAISLDQLYAFVTESDADLVEVIDLQSRISKAQIPVGPGPRGIVANPRANEVYVAKRSGAISIIDAVAHVEIDSIPVGNMGNGRLVVAPDGKRLYVTSSARLPRPEGQDSSTVARVLAIDPGARTVVDTLQLGAVSDPVTEISDLAMSRDGTRVFATLNWDFYQSLGSITTLGRASKFVTIEALGLEIAGELEIAGMERLFGCAVSPDDQTAYVIAKESIFDLTAQVLLLDLVQNESVGALLGLAVPFEIRVPAGKPAGVLSRPELAVF